MPIALAFRECSQGEIQMPKIEFQVPCLAKKRGAPIEYKTRSGNVAFFKIAGERIKFVLQQPEGSKEATELTHYASGMVFGRLNPLKIERMMAGGHHVRTSDRRAAEILILRAISNMGAEKVLATLKAAPVVNP
jgi:hypothetical protein